MEKVSTGYDLGGPWPGMLTHHSDACPARLGRPCTCGPMGYRASVDDADRQEPVIGPVLRTVEEALSWQREQQTAMHAFEAAAQSVDGHRADAPGPPVDGNAVWSARPVETHGYQAAPQPETVAAAVDEFLEAARAGEVTDAAGRPFDADEFRDLRWSLRGYVTSELGWMRIAELNGATLRAFVGQLDAAGLAPARTRSVVSGLRALLRYAAERGMVPWSTPDQLSFGDADELPYAAPFATRPQTAAVPVAQPAPPTAHSGFVSDEVIWMILKIVTLVFALIALVLVAESV
jgi:hypothetical protein